MLLILLWTINTGRGRFIIGTYTCLLSSTPGRDTPHGKMRYRGARNFRVFCLLPQLPRFSPFWKTRSRFSLCLKLRLQFLPFLLQISHYLSFFYSQISFLVKFQSNTRFITMKICNNNVLW